MTREERAEKLQQAFGDERAETIANELRNLDLNTLTPIDAMNKIAEWKRNI
jgi:hypothetical protein